MDGDGGLDVRVMRIEQGVVTIVLLAGFVFDVDWTIPLAAILVAADAALGDLGPVPWAWRATVAARVPAPRVMEPRAAVRMHQLVVGGALVVATLLVYTGLGGLATLLAIAVAAVTAACATGLVCAGCELHRRTHS